ncbi:MAG: polysaccharide biosynthesis C-terminal domain-containing protein [Lachnospiraceae bacterium]|nr:polysaccharide biosynthesis C-terminal domain-containing protein [Lachnospiraceae bacterium]
MKSDNKKTRTGYLLSNMALFTVSNFVSKLLVFFLVPFYTNVLTTSEYGTADVFASALLLAVPLLSVNAGEAALRFGIENEKERGGILRSGLRRVLISAGVVFALGAAALFLPVRADLRVFAALFAMIYLCDALYEFMLLYCQGCENVKVMITGSVSCTAIIIASNMVFLLVLHLGLYGYLFSQMAAYITSAVLMFFLIGGPKLLKQPENKELQKEMFSYGRGMLLYSTSSWINNALDRFYILLMLGTSSNGIYGAAYKIPAILMVFQRIFAQSFQMSATKSYKEKDSVKFFSKLYILYNAVMTSGCAVILLFLAPLSAFMFRKGFSIAYYYVPFLLISVIFGALNGFLGSVCLAYKDPKSMGEATAAGAALNMILNYVLITFFGLIGAAAATLASYFCMFAIAFVKTRRHVRLEINIIRDFGVYILLLAEGILSMRRIPYYYIYNLIIALIIVIIYLKQIRENVINLLAKLKRKQGDRDNDIKTE